MKKTNTKDYADLLRQLETKRLAKGTDYVKIYCSTGMGWLRWGVEGKEEGKNKGGNEEGKERVKRKEG